MRGSKKTLPLSLCTSSWGSHGSVSPMVYCCCILTEAWLRKWEYWAYGYGSLSVASLTRGGSVTLFYNNEISCVSVRCEESAVYSTDSILCILSSEYYVPLAANLWMLPTVFYPLDTSLWMLPTGWVFYPVDTILWMLPTGCNVLDAILRMLPSLSLDAIV